VRYRTIGKSDIVVSEIAFGCGGNAGLMVRGRPDEQVSVIGRALELGITYFDNAPDYGDGVAETNLGRALKALGIRPVLNTKVEVRKENLGENLGDLAGHIVRSAEASLRRLGVDYVDMLQIHNGPSRADPKLEGRSYSRLSLDHFLRPGGALDGIERLKRSGKIKYAGFICRGNDGAEVRQLLDTGVFHLINVPYTLFNPTAGRAKPNRLTVEKDFGDVISFAHARGAAAAVYSPLASGYLTDDSIAGKPRHDLARAYDLASPASLRLRHMARALTFLSHENGCTLAQAAFRFVLMHEGVASALGGFSTQAQLEEIAAVSGAPPFSVDQMQRLEALWNADFADGTDSVGA
jgi:aryl-alcohol dehydrogenase-like predicted oxidoreductase